MKSISGKLIKVGDVVQADDGVIGKVVASIDTGEYSTTFVKSDWEYLKEGIVVESEELGLVHYKSSNFEIIT